MAIKGGKPAFELSVDQQAVQKVAKALRAESDGKTLRKELMAELKTAVAPGVAAVQGKLRAIPHRSGAAGSPALGSYLASRVKPSVRLSGRSTGVKVRIGQTPNLRGFKMAARRLNRKSWRHPVFGDTKTWVTQQSPIPGYFDETLARDRGTYRAAVIRALEKMARKLAART